MTSELEVSVRHFNTLRRAMYGKDCYVSVRPPTVSLRVTSYFTGPYNTNWLYRAARKRANYDSLANVLIPFQPDIVTVDAVLHEPEAIRWTCLERVSDYRAWNIASKVLIVTSGALYGGSLPMLKRDGDYDILTGTRYLGLLRHEAVRLMPMVPGRVVSATMRDAKSITVDMEVTIGALTGVNMEDALKGHAAAIANHAMANSTISALMEEIE